ncbi:bifunctional phosphopantothenoylcysteine decarboxylase/phosphopantothenate--cysteine ligase CoaBC [Clostridiaceae bacterium HSG29]|nr:bifunctional phosphopantothenoylcysteine decarboxylase/phosphopantothenate--cysteine ligase CoaBC [Clostridiaceae bacterium HSG29]
METLKGKNIVLCVTGGIAVYKAVDVVSKLKKLGANVDVVMTKNATEFVSPLTFQSLSHNKVIDDMFSETKYWDIEHISLAQKADIFVVVPATTNVVGKIANGIADDMVTTTIMATKAKVLIAPAMNTNMYTNPIYQENEKKLRSLGYLFINPASGKLACGDVGAGKLADTQDIVDRVEYELSIEEKLKNIRILVTAGPTVEKIDPVRFITNRSTGKMGYAIAKQAKLMGAEVTLITGPTNIEKPYVDNIIEIESADEMYKEVIENKDVDAVIMTAAVSDYRPKEYVDKKIKKSDTDLVLELGRNKDILFELGKIKENQLLIGFAAETNNVKEYALKKLREKNLDLIVANDVSNKEIGFGSDSNEVIFFDKNENEFEFKKMSKDLVALEIINKIIDLLKE